ncbi:MAG: radical SAM protein, partial [Candidatus Sumerlaeota bacterium]
MTNTEVRNRGICSKCHKITPVRHETRDGKIYLIKDCPDCGVTETVVSNNAERYLGKRDLMGYEGEAQQTCSLDCVHCKNHKNPTLVFIDVTNRCNMNCPICLANIPAMGFRFDPPMSYFEKIFEKLSQMDPKPKIQLFGGEPTVREDLVDMINLAKEKYGLQARVVTNGLRLANEEYCKKLVSTGAQLMYSFDGEDAEIYAKTRKHPKAFERKIQGLENLGKYRKSKITLMTCVGEGINDKHMADMVQFCHDRRSYIAALDLIPLTAHWGPEEIGYDSAT